jgi:hypothetical protein
LLFIRGLERRDSTFINGLIFIMKHLLLAASMLCMTLLSFSQDQERSKEYPRLKKETS